VHRAIGVQRDEVLRQQGRKRVGVARQGRLDPLIFHVHQRLRDRTGCLGAASLGGLLRDRDAEGHENNRPGRQ
jgi:hypothetical protein